MDITNFLKTITGIPVMTMALFISESVVMAEAGETNAPEKGYQLETLTVTA